MADPELRKLLEYARPVREFSQAIQTSFRLIEAALAAEGTLASAKTRAETALQEAQALEARKTTLVEEVAKERESLRVPLVAEKKKLEDALTALRERIQGEQSAFDDERSRRTAILRGLDEKTKEAERAHGERLVTLKKEADQAKGTAQNEIDRLKAQADEERSKLTQLRIEYQAVQNDAAKLAGLAGRR